MGRGFLFIEIPIDGISYFCYSLSIMPKNRTKYDALLRIARRGPIRARDLVTEGIPRAYLRRLADRGVLVRTDRGLYRLAEAEAVEHSSLADVAIRVPDATICLYSALRFHELTTQIPHSVWIMIDRTRRAPKIENPSIEVVRASGRARSHGIETWVIEGVDIQITTPAKTVADCFRYERHVGLDVALEALRDYVHGSRGTIDSLVEASRADRVYARMRPYIEATV